MSDTYRVVVTREDGTWLADVPQLAGAHTEARSLAGLDAAVREVIALVEDLPEGAEPGLQLAFEYHTGDAALDEQTAWLRAERDRIRREDSALTEFTEQLARRLRPTWSVRDVAALLGVSPQRISQIAPDERPSRRGRRRAAA